MKKILTLVIFTILVSQFSFAQDCKMYFPEKKGAVLEIKQYDNKGKETETNTYTVKESTVSGGEKTVKMEFNTKTKGTDDGATIDYVVKCKDGKFFVNMESLVAGQMEAYKDMDVEVDADNLEIPSDVKAGQLLNNGSATAVAKTNGMAVMTVKVDVSERKCEGTETVTTPAGTFECVKITYKSYSKIGFMKVQATCIDWYCEGVGPVKTEVYNKKGKKVSYSILNKATGL